MSTITNRTPPSDGGSEEHSLDQRLARLLDTPFLAQVVPHLAPETLHQLIQYRGLDACGELVTCATPAQLTSLLDLDLWRHTQPGRDEQFDVERFGEWLEVLVDTSESAAARTVAALDSHLVIVGLSRYLRVFDPGTFEPVSQSDDESIERHDLMNSETSRNVLECEIGGYLLRARRTDAWDAIVALLVTLEIEHNDYFHTVMQGCRPLSHSRPEIDDLNDLLMAPEQYLHDVAVEREQRQSRHGYVSAADARAFLHLARQRRSAAMPTTTNPVAAEFFRSAEEEPSVAPSDHDATNSAVTDQNIPASIDAVVALLAEAGVMPSRPLALLESAVDDPQAGQLPFLKRLMQFVMHHDEAAYLARTRELAFLANTLLAGGSVQSRPFTPREASDAAAAICNLGLESRNLETTLPEEFLADHDLVTMFEVGWSVLYRDVSLFVVDQLISILPGLGSIDADTRAELRALERKLVKEREAGTPWLARDAVDVLSMLDTPAWISVVGLLDECPIVPAALGAILDRSTTSISATDFAFISTIAQVGDIRLFMRMLPAVLSR